LLIYLLIFGDEVPFFCLGLVWDVILLTYASCLARISGTCHHDHLITWDSISLTFLAGLASNNNPPDFYLLSSWDYSCIPLCPAWKPILNNDYLTHCAVPLYLNKYNGIWSTYMDTHTDMHTSSFILKLVHSYTHSLLTSWLNRSIYLISHWLFLATQNMFNYIPLWPSSVSLWKAN
jgi:hypothetical protein